MKHSPTGVGFVFKQTFSDHNFQTTSGRRKGYGSNPIVSVVQHFCLLYMSKELVTTMLGNSPVLLGELQENSCHSE